MEAPTGSALVARTGQTEIYPFIPTELIEATAASADTSRSSGGWVSGSALVVPPHRSRRHGRTLTLIHAESGRRYSEEDVAFLEAVADRAAVALDRPPPSAPVRAARRGGADRRGRAACHPATARPVGTVALSTRYLSAAVEAQISGDLYESSPRPSSVRILVGDVLGEGLSASAPRRSCSASPRRRRRHGDVAHVAHRSIAASFLPAGRRGFVTGSWSTSVPTAASTSSPAAAPRPCSCPPR